MIGIIGAMKAEIDGIKQMLENPQSKTLSGIEFVFGKVGSKEVVAAQSGIGKVFAAICTEAMILEFCPDLIINVGVGGTMSDNLGVFDIALATAVVQHDMDTSPLGDPVGLLSGINIVEIPCNKAAIDKLSSCIEEAGLKYEKGIIASGDRFIASEKQKAKIRESFSPIACEMEGGSIGHVCYVNNVDFAVLRAISDGANDGAAVDYPAFMEMAAKNSVRVMEKFLKR